MHGTSAASASTIYTSSDPSDHEDDDDLSEDTPTPSMKRKRANTSPKQTQSPPVTPSLKRRAALKLPELDLADSVQAPAPLSSVRSTGPSVLRQTPRSPFQYSPHVFTFPPQFVSMDGHACGYHPGLPSLGLFSPAPAAEETDTDVRAALALVNMAQHMDAVFSQRSPRPIDFC